MRPRHRDGGGPSKHQRHWHDGDRAGAAGHRGAPRRIETRIDGACGEQVECERRCAQKREPIYNRIGALEVNMGKVTLQTALIIGIVCFLGSAVAAAVVDAIAKAVAK